MFIAAIRVLQKLAQATAWLFSLMIVLLSVGAPSTRPVTSVGHNFEHLLIFLATGVAFAFGYPRYIRLLPIGLVTFAIAIEMAQLMVPGRHARVSDFLTDAAASLVGIYISYAAIRMLSKYDHNAEIDQDYRK